VTTNLSAPRAVRLALLAGAGHLSSGQPHLGIIDVTVDLAAA
jgi:hypothetical protein